MNNEKLSALVNNTAAMARLAECESLEEVYEFLNKNGVDCTMDDANNLVRIWRNNSADDGAMDLDDMEYVAGGGMFTDIVKVSSPFKPASSPDEKKNFSF